MKALIRKVEKITDNRKNQPKTILDIELEKLKDSETKKKEFNTVVLNSLLKEKNKFFKKKPLID